MSKGWNSRVRCVHCGLMGSKQRGRVRLTKHDGDRLMELHGEDNTATQKHTWLHQQCIAAFLPTQKRQQIGVITSAHISALPARLGDPLPVVFVSLVGESHPVRLFDYYPDEISFTEREFIGLTLDEARALKHSKDVRYLRS